jgi:tryptophan 2,3-dioxygenase
MARTEYEGYIRTDELLDLQKPERDLSNPDEILFQITHQAMELWMKAIAHDVRRVPGLVDEGRVQRATHLLERIAEMIGVCSAQLHVLERMEPADYHPIRLGLGRGSGQDSPGFNWLLKEAAPLLWPAFERLREASGAPSLLDLFGDPERDVGLYRLAQALMEVDTAFQKFRYLHYALVRRIIGSEVRSLKDVPASQLIHGAVEPLFPPLWQVINDLTRTYRPEY